MHGLLGFKAGQAHPNESDGTLAGICSVEQYGRCIRDATGVDCGGLECAGPGDGGEITVADLQCDGTGWTASGDEAFACALGQSADAAEKLSDIIDIFGEGALGST